MNLTTYILANLSNDTLKKLSINVNDKIHYITNAVNIYRTIADHNMQYLWFGDFCRVLGADNSADFYSGLYGQRGNMVETPLGYDGTCCAAMFVPTMHYNFPIDQVDLSEKDKFDPIYCYKINGKLHIPYDILDDKKTGNSSIYAHIYQGISKKYSHLRCRDDKGGFDKDDFAEFCRLTKIEGDEALEFIKSQPQNVEFEYNGEKYVKCIPIDDPDMIYSMLVSDNHFAE